MKPKVQKSRYLLLCFLVLMIGGLMFGEEAAEVQGRVLNNGSFVFSIKVAYSEIDGLGEKTTRYFDETGRLRLEEKEIFRPETIELTRFNLKDFKSGREEEFFKQQDKIVIRYKKDSQSDFKEKIKNRYRDLVHGSMIVLLIEKNIKQVVEGRKISFSLLVPKYLTVYGFSLKKEKEVRVDGCDCYVIKMYPSSFLLRGLVKPTYFFVEKNAPHRFLRFEGLITPKANNGSSFNGVVEFSYGNS